MQLLLVGVLFFTVSNIEAQWGRPIWGDRYQRGMVYRSRPRVSVGIGAYGGFGLYPGYWGLLMGPGMGLSIGMNVPCVGIRLNALPPGRVTRNSGDDPVYNDTGRNYPSVNDPYTPSDDQQNRAATSDDYNTGPQVGDRFEQLPRNSRAISVDGAKQYVSPGGTYYKEVQEEDRTVYEVVRTR